MGGMPKSLFYVATWRKGRIFQQFHRGPGAQCVALLGREPREGIPRAAAAAGIPIRRLTRQVTSPDLVQEGLSEGPAIPTQQTWFPGLRRPEVELGAAGG